MGDKNPNKVKKKKKTVEKVSATSTVGAGMTTEKKNKK